MATIFGTHNTQYAIVKRAFTNVADDCGNRFAIDKLLFVHHFGVVMAGFDHFRQRTAT